MVNSKKDLKHLINQIHKLAAPPPPPVGYTGPASAPAPSPAPPNLPPPPAPPIGTPAGTTTNAPPADRPGTVVEPTTQAGSSAVKNMQVGLKNLANAMTKQVDVGALGGPEQQAYGRMSFADFITQHYTRNSDIPGVEYDWDPKKTQMEEKDPTKPTRTNVVMDTMRRVGGPKSEFKLDGVWGPRTNASLRNAYAMAFGLLEMAKSFKYNPKAYSASDLRNLKNMIPHTDTELSATEKEERAAEITKHLQAITNLYHEIESRIFDKPAYKKFIDGTQSYVTYDAGTAPDPKLVAALNNKFNNMQISGASGNQKVTAPITVSDLVSVHTLSAWQRKNMPNTPLPDILAQIKGYLNVGSTNRGVS